MSNGMSNGSDEGANGRSVADQPNPSLVINAFSNWATLGLNIVIGIVLTPVIIHYLGKPGFGIWTLINSFVGYYGLVNLGVGSAITRYVGRYAGQRDLDAMHRTVGTALSMFSFTGMLAFCISLLIAGPLVEFFNVEPAYQRQFQLVVIILGLATGLEFPGNLFGASLQAHERFVPANAVNIIRALVRASLTVGMLMMGSGLVGVAVAALVAALIGLVGRYTLCRMLIPELHFSYRQARWNVLGMLLKFGAFSTVIMVADILRHNISSLVIAKCVDMSAVGVYAVAALIVRYMGRVIITALNVLTPRFAKLDGKGEKDQLDALFMRSLSIASLMAFGMGMLFIILGGRIVTLWVGPEYADSVPVLWILVFSAMFGLSQNPAIGLLYALNKHKFYAYATIVEGVFNVTLSLILVWKYGIIGVALGTAIPMLIVKVGVMPIYVTRVVGLSLWDYLKRLIMPACISGAAVWFGWKADLVTNWQDVSFAVTSLWGIGFGAGFLFLVIVGFHLVGAPLFDIRRHMAGGAP